MKIKMTDLDKIKFLIIQINRLQEKLYDSNYGVGFKIQDRVVSSNVPNLPEQEIITKEDIEEKINKKIKSYFKQIKYVEDKFDEIDNYKLRTFAIFKHLDLLSTEEISERMGISERTVYNYNYLFNKEYVEDDLSDKR